MITTKFVKIRADRGYGNGIYKVVGSKNPGKMEEVTLQPVDGGPNVQIYSAHTYRDSDCVRMQVSVSKEKREAAQKIGTKNKRK